MSGWVKAHDALDTNDHLAAAEAEERRAPRVVCTCGEYYAQNGKLLCQECRQQMGLPVEGRLTPQGR